MEEKRFKELVTRAENFKYSDLKYVEYEELKDYEILCDDKNLILLYGMDDESGVHRYRWACSSFDSIAKYIGKKGDALLGFVP